MKFVVCVCVGVVEVKCELMGVMVVVVKDGCDEKDDDDDVKCVMELYRLLNRVFDCVVCE